MPVAEANVPVTVPLSTRTVPAVATTEAPLPFKTAWPAMTSVPPFSAVNRPEPLMLELERTRDCPETSADATPLLVSVPPVKKLKVAP